MVVLVSFLLISNALAYALGVTTKYCLYMSAPELMFLKSTKTFAKFSCVIVDPFAKLKVVLAPG